MKDVARDIKTQKGWVKQTFSDLPVLMCNYIPVVQVSNQQSCIHISLEGTTYTTILPPRRW